MYYNTELTEMSKPAEHYYLQNCHVPLARSGQWRSFFFIIYSIYRSKLIKDYRLGQRDIKNYTKLKCLSFLGHIFIEVTVTVLAQLNFIVYLSFKCCSALSFKPTTCLLYRESFNFTG